MDTDFSSKPKTQSGSDAALAFDHAISHTGSTVFGSEGVSWFVTSVYYHGNDVIMCEVDISTSSSYKEDACNAVMSELISQGGSSCPGYSVEFNCKF